jgi:hypothetical protein
MNKEDGSLYFDPKKDAQVRSECTALLEELQHRGHNIWSIYPISKYISLTLAEKMNVQGISEISKSKKTGSTFTLYSRKRNALNIEIRMKRLRTQKRDNSDML